MKAAFRAHDLPVVKYAWLTRKRWQASPDAIADDIEKLLGYPVFVKPANLGSSIGISKANDRAGLYDAIEVAAHYDRRLLVEEAFEGGIEVNCAVLGNDEPRASVCEQPIAWTDILSYEDKYLRGGKGKGGGGEGMASLTRRIPAPISDELTATIQRLAIAAFLAIDCSGIARVDFLVDSNDGRVAVNEINTMPGSLSFYLWEPSGLPFPALIDELVDLAIERHQERQQTSYSFDSALLQKFSRGKAQ
jgi:D-alanine-D-alanine ligase